MNNSPNKQNTYPPAAAISVVGIASTFGGGGISVCAQRGSGVAPLPLAPSQPVYDPLAGLKATCEGLAPVEKPPEIDQPGTLLADFANPLPEKDNPAALFKNGFIRKGMGWVLVALAGIGKSAWTIQGSILWAMGKSFFGITPIRPLNIAIIQSEDDKEEVAHFRNEITKGLLADTYDKQHIDEAMTKVRVFEFMGLVGEAFCDKLRTLLACYPDLDLVIINPLQAYLGCNVSDNSDVTKFLRTMIDPIIKPSRVAVLFVHHTNKPPNAKDRAGWGTDAFAAYAGAGGAEISNWTRAQLTIIPVEGKPGVFTLTAGKRGGRLGWTDSDGAPTFKRCIAHSEGLIYWREATSEEAIPAAREGKANSNRSIDRVVTTETLFKILARAAEPLPSGVLLEKLMEGAGIGEAAARRIIRVAVEKGTLAEVTDKGPPRRVLKGTPQQIEEYKCPKLPL